MRSSSVNGGGTHRLVQDPDRCSVIWGQEDRTLNVQRWFSESDLSRGRDRFIYCFSGMKVNNYGSNPQKGRRRIHHLDETRNLHQARISRKTKKSNTSRWVFRGKEEGP